MHKTRKALSRVVRKTGMVAGTSAVPRQNPGTRAHRAECARRKEGARITAHINVPDAGPTLTGLRSLVLLGDDLSGTAEALTTALDGGRATGRVYLHLRSFHARSAQPSGADPVSSWDAVDLDVRRLPHDAARAQYAAAVQRTLGADRSDVLLLKVDSLLRGNVAAAVAAVPPAPHRPVVLAPALPAQGRRTVHGRVRLDREGPRPGSLEGAHVDAATAAGRPTVLIDLDVVRAGDQVLGTLLGELAHEGVVAVCDAETDTDLDMVAAAATQHLRPVVIGAAGVVAAVGRALRAKGARTRGGSSSTDQGCPGPRASDAPVLVVVGTAEPSARAQVARLEETGAVVETVEPSGRERAAETASRLDKALATGCTVLQVASGPLDRDRSGPVLDNLANLAAGVLQRRPDIGLVVTGGATARAVLTRLGVQTLRPHCQVHPGAAHLTTDGNRGVVTRPGSHGGPDSLVQLARHLGASLALRTPQPAQVRCVYSTEGQE